MAYISDQRHHMCRKTTTAPHWGRILFCSLTSGGMMSGVKSQEPVTITRCSIQTQYVNAIHTLSLSVPLGILNISLCFRECICPLRPPDHRTAWAKGFICDYWQFETALSLSLRDYLENILIISCKITTLMILLETQIMSFWGTNVFFRAEATDTPETTLHFL